MVNPDKAEFTDRHMFNGMQGRKLYDYMYLKFRKHMTLLMEQKKPRKVSSQKGLLNPRNLYRHQFSDNVFQKTITSPSSDTTIVFLIDGSGSMAEMTETPVGRATRLDLCTSVAAAFAKANQEVLKGKLSLEILVKSASGGYSYVYNQNSPTGTSNGKPVFLTRVYSSSKHSKGALDRLLSLTPVCPVQVNGRCDHSYTSEYSILPGLTQWMKKNVKTKRTIVFNLTDGDTFCEIGSDDFEFRNPQTSMMYAKYLSKVPNVTLMIDSRYDKQTLQRTYGDNVIASNRDFSGLLFQTFARFID